MGVQVGALDENQCKSLGWWPIKTAHDVLASWTLASWRVKMSQTRGPTRRDGGLLPSTRYHCGAHATQRIDRTVVPDASTLLNQRPMRQAPRPLVVIGTARSESLFLVPIHQKSIVSIVGHHAKLSPACSVLGPAYYILADVNVGALGRLLATSLLVVHTYSKARRTLRSWGPRIQRLGEVQELGGHPNFIYVGIGLVRHGHGVVLGVQQLER